MKLEKAIYLGELFDLYGVLLTNKQQHIFKCYYFDDISLGEIAEFSQISKQAVKDSLDKSEKLLIQYEDKLKLYEKQLKVQEELQSNPKLLEKFKNIWKESWFVSI